MTRPIVLRRAARIEYDEAGDRYEQIRSGLGIAFTVAVEKVFKRIAFNPKLHGIVLRDIRKAIVSGFPYCVYYRERRSVVAVISVFHTSRNPAIWQKRN